MSTRQIHVFVSHSWRHAHHYETIRSWIFDRTWRFGQASLRLHNYSVPRDYPIVGAQGVRALRDAIFDQIRRSHVVVIPAGMYAHHSTWIGEEIRGSALYGRPIVAVHPRGAQRVPGSVLDVADEVVGWNASSLVRAVWELYRDRF